MAKYSKNFVAVFNKITEMEDYYISIFFDSNKGVYIADIPDLKECSACGLSPLIALHEVLLAKEQWIQKAKDEGREIPEPSYRPLIYHPDLLS